MTIAQPDSMAASSHGSFVPASFLHDLASVTRADADACAFGVVQCDDQGNILLYNQWESDMAGVVASNAEGRNFFTQVAPCANNGLFYGTFKKGVAANQMNVRFPYTFTYKMRPTNVRIHLYRCPASRTNWIFVAYG